MLRIGITGPRGFLAWHTRCALRAFHGIEIVEIGREEFSNPSAMDAALNGVDVVLHLAAINRANSPKQVVEGNLGLATLLRDGLIRQERSLRVVHSNSIQSKLGNPFGDSKAATAEILNETAAETCSDFIDIVFPNIFGEHGLPNYNSFVATFCDKLSRGERPEIIEDRVVPLMHAQKAASVLLEAVSTLIPGSYTPTGVNKTVGEVASILEAMSEAYRSGQFPDLADDFIQDLFNTYRSYTFPNYFPIFPDAMTDERGRLVEAVRAGGGETQVFFSTTKPGKTRGEHFHLRKVERFLVLQGTAEIRLRRMYDGELITYTTVGERSAIVDMPTMWAHSITNVGDNDLITLFYADQCFNPNSPDTYPERVCLL